MPQHVNRNPRPTLRWAQWGLLLTWLLVGLVLTIIVIKSLKTEHGEQAGRIVKKQAAVERIDIRGLGGLDYQHLFTARSEPGESLDAFMVRIGSRLRDWTRAEGFEACAAIASDGERFGVVVGTNRGHTVCVNFHAKVPVGMTATGQTVHSHTTMRRYRLTQADLLVVGGGRVGAVQRGDNPELFSEEDFSAPGYMVSGTTVWHQAGKGTERAVGALVP